MLSEIAINDPETFKKFVAIAKDGLAGKIKKEETDKASEITIKSLKNESIKEIKAEAKKETKKEEKKPVVKTETTDFSKMTLSDLKTLAKEKNIKGYSTMKKADLIKNLK